MSITLSNREGIQYGTSVEMKTVICYKCSIPFAMPERLNEWLRRSQDSFFCPNGHIQAYVKSTEQILKEKIERQKQEFESKKSSLERTIERTIEQRDNVIKDRTVLKGKLTKQTNRIKNGVCPCCNRTFQNLMDHMKKQHPEFNQ